jgi:hypothetical protein
MHDVSKTGSNCLWQEATGGSAGYSTSCLGAGTGTLPAGNQVSSTEGLIIFINLTAIHKCSVNMACRLPYFHAGQKFGDEIPPLAQLARVQTRPATA